MPPSSGSTTVEVRVRRRLCRSPTRGGPGRVPLASGRNRRLSVPENSAVVVDVLRRGPMPSPRVPNLVPIPGPRMEAGPHTASPPTEGPPQRAFVPRPPTDPSFDAIVISFRCVSSGSHMFVFSSHTRPAHSETSTAALTTPALDRRSLRWFGISRPHGDPAGPTPITGTARIVPTIFYIIITSLQDTRGCRKLGRGR